MNKQDIERMARAWQEVTENRFVIPEEIPANERTAFHGAAAAASKAGKKSFSFAGKTHPVTMKKDTATKIADQKEETEVNELKTSTYKSYMKKSEKDDEKAYKTGDYNRSVKRGIGQAMASDALKRKAAKEENMDDDKEERMHSTDKTKNTPVKKKAGDTAIMNPKMDTDKKATSESRIRKALMGVLSEKENHSPNKDKAETMDDKFKGDGAKQMKKDLEGPTVDIEKQSHDDAAKAGRAGPSTKMRSNDNKQGDKKVVNPVAGVVTKEK